MTDVAISAVLAQMRETTAKMGSEIGVESASSASSGSFSQMVQQSIDDLNETMQKTKALGGAFERGDPSVSLAEVMINSQKASLEFQAMKEVRNKFLMAYQEVMSMQV